MAPKKLTRGLCFGAQVTIYSWREWHWSCTLGATFLNLYPICFRTQGMQYVFSFYSVNLPDRYFTLTLSFMLSHHLSPLIGLHGEGAYPLYLALGGRVKGGLLPLTPTIPHKSLRLTLL